MKKIFTLFLMLCLTASLTGCAQEKNGNDTKGITQKEENGKSGTTDETPGQSDLTPMVMVNGTLYFDTGRESEIDGRCGNMDGEITAAVDSTEIPSLDGQSNFGSGFGYQLGENGTIEVNMNEKWFVFEQRWVDYTFDDSERGVKFSLKYPEGWKLTEEKGWDGDETRDASPSVGVSFLGEEEVFNVFAILFAPYDFEEDTVPFETDEGLKGSVATIRNEGQVYVYYVFGDGETLPQYTGIVNMSEENYEKKKSDIEAVLKTLKIEAVS